MVDLYTVQTCTQNSVMLDDFFCPQHWISSFSLRLLCVSSTESVNFLVLHKENPNCPHGLKLPRISSKLYNDDTWKNLFICLLSLRYGSISFHGIYYAATLLFPPLLQSRCCSTLIHKHEMLCFFSVLCSFSTLLQFFFFVILLHSPLYIIETSRIARVFLWFSSFRCSPSPCGMSLRAKGMCRFDMTTLWVNRKTEHRKLLARLFETWTSESEEVKSKHRANCEFPSSTTLVVLVTLEKATRNWLGLWTRKVFAKRKKV